MRLVFMGTPDFAVPSLAALAQHHEVVAVFTQPDRPAGRSQQLKMSPVKQKALELNIPVYQPQRIKEPGAVEQLRKLNPEAIVVVAYGQILSREILDLPRYGCINAHASLLPYYRGAAPIHWAIINGEKVSGVTTMLMNEGLDTGDMLLKRELPIPMDMTTGQLHDALAEMGAALILETLEGIQAGTIIPTPQSGESSYAPQLKREHEQINWNQTAVEIHNRIRGLNPWPGAFTTFRGENLKVWKSRVVTEDASAINASADNVSADNVSADNVSADNVSGETISAGQAEAGKIRAISDQGILVQTGKGVVELIEVQPAGKRVMSAKDFFNGRRVQIGEQFM